MSYASKYLCKPGDVPEGFVFVGRWWGCIGRRNLPVEMLKILVTWEQFHKYRRILHKHRVASSRAAPGAPPGWVPRASTGLLSGISAFIDYRAANRLVDALGDWDSGIPDAGQDDLTLRAEALWLLAACRVEVARLRLLRLG
jgi:hypothetical protein